MKYFIDTNIFLRFYINENKKVFREVSETIRQISKNKIEAVTSGVVLSEIVWVLGSFYKENKRSISKALDGVLNIKYLNIVDSYNYNYAVELYKKFNIKFIDCLIASIPQIAAREWTIVSYDEDFKKLPVLWKKPSALAA